MPKIPTKEEAEKTRQESLRTNSKKWKILIKILGEESEKYKRSFTALNLEPPPKTLQPHLWELYTNKDYTKPFPPFSRLPEKLRKKVINEFRALGFIEDSAILQTRNEKESYEEGRYIKEKEMQNKQSKKQKEIRAQRKTWGGKTKAQIKERNQRIIDKFNKSKITANNFANKYQNIFGLKPSQIRTIIRTAIKK